VYFDKGMANEFVDHWMTAAGRLSGLFKQGSYTQVYGCLEFFLRDSDCPLDFSESLNDVLKSNLAPYTIIDGNTITPIASHEQGLLLAHALDQLSNSPMVGASQHLKQAIEFLNKGQWAKSITESIRAVESVARKIEPSANTLDPALKNLAPKIGMHPAMQKSFSMLYGFTSDEQGIRHALIDKNAAAVDRDDAIFMLTACAAFSSYLVNRAIGANLL